MAAIHVSQLSPFVVVFGQEKGSVRTLMSVVVEYPVHGEQQVARTHQRQLALNPEIRLEIRHQKSSGDSLARNIARDQSRSGRCLDRGNRNSRLRPCGPGCTIPRIPVCGSAAWSEGTAWPAPAWRSRVPVPRDVPLPVSRRSPAVESQCSRVTSSSPTNANKFPSGSLKCVNTPPQTGPALDHRDCRSHTSLASVAARTETVRRACATRHTWQGHHP